MCTAARRFLVVLLLFLPACGNGPNDDRPTEILFFAQGPQGTPFELEPNGNAPDCLAFSTSLGPPLVPSAGRGLQSHDAEHLFSNTFLAPYFFIIENEQQPVRGVFRNLSDAAPLNVQRLLFGGDLLTAVEIGPQQCRSITTFSDAAEATAVPPLRRGPEVRVDVCSFDRDTDLPGDFRCTDAPALGGSAPLVDRQAIFFASIGDLAGTNRTQCLLIQGSSRNQCQTPATMFLNDPQDSVSVVITPITNQTSPDRRFHGDLYLDGERVDSDTPSVGGDVILIRDI